MVRETETTYIECSMRTDFVMAKPHFAEVEPDTAEQAITNLALTGQY